MATSIEWTNVADNIIVAKGGGWWCRMISPGCANCYAARLNQSPFFGGNKLAYAGRTPELELRRDVIDGWARQRQPKKHFVASMTDIFGEWVEREWIFYFLDGMLAAPRQTFQMLTKRPAVAAREIAAWLEARGMKQLPWHMQIGTSVEDQPRADERIPLLLSIPATVRFLSCEPLITPVDLRHVQHDRVVEIDALTGDHGVVRPLRGRGEARVHWVICGGESGPRARPMHPGWARSLRNQCAETDTRFFFKQHGACLSTGQMHGSLNGTLADAYQKPTGVFPDGLRFYRVGKKAAGRLLDGRLHNEFPAVVQPAS